MELPLTNSDKKVIVDQDVYDELVGRTISLCGGHYARFWDGEKQKTCYVHRYVMGNPDSQVDHINRNTLDCRRANLRLATCSQNSANRGKTKGTTSQYIGVDYVNGRWRARCYVDGKRKNLGRYDDEVEAAKVRDKAALEEYGSFAQLNFPDEPYEFRVKYVPSRQPLIINNYYNCTISISQ